MADLLIKHALVLTFDQNALMGTVIADGAGAVEGKPRLSLKQMSEPPEGFTPRPSFGGGPRRGPGGPGGPRRGPPRR